MGWFAIVALALLRPEGAAPRAQTVLTTAPDGPSMREGLVEIEPGVRLYYRIEGSGRDTVIVPFASLLRDALATLAKQHTVIFYDMRSRGRSSVVRDTARLGIRLDVQDLEGIRRHFQVEHPGIVGFSYLGAVGALYAATYPNRPSRLALLGPLGPRAQLVAQAQATALTRLDSASLATLTAALRNTTSNADGESLCRQFWDVYLPLYIGDAPRSALVRETLEATCRLPNEWPRAFLRTLQHVFSSMGTWDWSEEARRVDAPTLVIQGDRDLVAPTDGGIEWARLIRGARLLTVRGAGHLAWAEAPTAVIPALERFLSGEWPDAAHPIQ
jgi:pimeloyl-ACP methyl ester carboxylesterase